MEEIGKALETLVAASEPACRSGADRILTVEPRAGKEMPLGEGPIAPDSARARCAPIRIGDCARLLIFPYKVDKSNFALLSEKELKKHEHVYKVLSANRTRLSQECGLEKANETLGRVVWNDVPGFLQVVFVATHPNAFAQQPLQTSLLGKELCLLQARRVLRPLFAREDVQEDILYLLGLLNSRLLSFYAVGHSPVFSGAYYKFSAPYLKQLPIRRIDFSDRADKAPMTAW